MPPVVHDTFQRCRVPLDVIDPHGDFIRHLARNSAAFGGPHLNMVVDSMLAGNTLGKLWSAEQGDTRVLVLWDRGNNVFYLVGEGGESVAGLLFGTLQGDLMPVAQDSGRSRSKVHAVTPHLEESIPRLFEGLPLQRSITRFYEHTGGVADVPAPALPDVSFLPVSRKLLLQGLAGMDSMREEIRGMWPSEERFVANGFGIVAVVADGVIGFCTTEYLGPARCGIGIATSSRYRRRGVATASSGRPRRVA